MITKQELISYIHKVPTPQKGLLDAIKHIDHHAIEKASVGLSATPSVIAYFQNYSQRGVTPLQDLNPSMSTLLAFFGSRRSKALLYSFILSSLVPKEWEVFPMSDELFFSLNDRLLSAWEKLLLSKAPDLSMHYIGATSLFCTSIAICDALFADHKNTVDFLGHTDNVTLNDHLASVTGMSLFDLSVVIGKKLGFDPKTLEVLSYAESPVAKATNLTQELGRYLHLLLFYVLCEPAYIQANLNSFLRFMPEETEELVEELMILLGERE